ncbi:hypothetical protein [Ruegeria sp.]|uniref:hypothetical protein n=1 Tax=Ruegeria sp. TaxID=1879320 RepID=UPI003B5CFF80
MSGEEFIGSINQWFVDHSPLVTFVIVPIISAFVAFFSSKYSTRIALRAAVQQRKHEATGLLSQFRQDWINDLRNEIAEHQSICLGTAMVFKDQEPSGISDAKVPAEKMYRLTELANRILLRLNPADPDYQALSTALAVQRKNIHEQGQPNLQTLSIAQRILKREWDRLKEDLRENAESNTQ